MGCDVDSPARGWHGRQHAEHAIGLAYQSGTGRDQPRSAAVRQQDDVQIPAFLRRQSDGDAPVSLQDMVTAVSDYLDRSPVVLGLAAHCDRLALHADARRALGEAVAVGLSRDEAWLALACWASTQPGTQPCTLGAGIQTALQRLVDQIDAAQRTRCLAVFDQILGGHASQSWTPTRAERLLQTIGRSSAT